MRPQAFADARFQNWHVPFRVQTTAVDDADAAMAAVAAVVDESPHARARLHRRLAVQVAPIRDWVLPALQLSDFAPVDARRREVVIRFIEKSRSGGPRLLRRRQGNWPTLPDPPARIAWKREHVRHLARKRVGVGWVISGRCAGRRLLPYALHRTIVRPRLSPLHAPTRRTRESPQWNATRDLLPRADLPAKAHDFT